MLRHHFLVDAAIHHQRALRRRLARYDSAGVLNEDTKQAAWPAARATAVLFWGMSQNRTAISGQLMCYVNRTS
jgi:hypothetical protein